MSRPHAIRTLLLCALLATPARVALAEGAPVDRRPTVAVLYFDYAGKDGQLEVLRKGLAQMLISDLTSLPPVRIVERDRLEEVLAELKLQQTARIDPESAVKMGKLLGARYLVLGSYFDLMGSLRADARLVEVETGRVVASYGANGKPDDFLAVEQKLSQELSGGLRAAAATAGEGARPEGPPPDKARPKAPARLRTRTAVRYARALDALDRKDKQAARAELQEVVKEQPDFALAALDLAALIR